MSRYTKNILHTLVLCVLGTATIQCSSSAPHQFVLEEIPDLVDYSPEEESIGEMLGVETIALCFGAAHQTLKPIPNGGKDALRGIVTYNARLIFDSFWEKMADSCCYYGMNKGIVRGKRLQLIYLLNSAFKGYLFMVIDDETATPDTLLIEDCSVKNLTILNPTYAKLFIDLFLRGKRGK